MKKNVMSALNTISQSSAAIAALQEMFPAMNVQAVFNEVATEWGKNREKSEANAKIYAAAKEPVFAVLSDTPQTVKEIFAEIEDDLPENFSPSKLQWALLNLWNDEVVAHDNGKNPKTYTLKIQ